MFKFIFCLAVASLCCACTDQQDPQELQYCSMIKRWKADEAAGIAPQNRTGWPPFKGEC